MLCWRRMTQELKFDWGKQVVINCAFCEQNEGVTPWDLGMKTFEMHANRLVEIHNREHPDHVVKIDPLKQVQK